MTQREPTGPYVYQPGGYLPFAVAGPGAEAFDGQRFATKEHAHAVVDLLHKLKNLRHAGLAAVGFLGGQSILTKEQLQKTLADAVKPIL